MPVLRFIAGLLILAAVVTLVADASGWLAGTAPFQAKSLQQHWAELSPRSLAAARAGAGPGAWAALIEPLVRLPTVFSLTVLGVGIGWLGRRRRKIKVYAN